MATSNLEIIITANDQASGKLQGLSESLGNFGKGLTDAGKKLSLGITAPIVALGTLAVMSASDFEEAANKVSVVFGDAAGGVKAFADDASNALGMSSAQALEAAGTYGNLFTAMGIGQEQAAGMSTELLTLAADLASFNNIDPAVALEKLRAGLTGETEPLKTLGVNLSAAGIELKALEMGLISEGETLDAAAKAQAAYALIMEQTTNAQGDFARTSDGLANTTRIIKAQFADVAAELGAVLLPIVSQLATWLKTLMERFQGLTPEQKKMIVVIAGIAAAIGPLLIVIGTLISALGTIIPIVGAVVGVLSGPILLVIGLIVGAIALLALAWKNNWGDIQGKTQAVVDWLREKIGTFIEWMRAFWDQHGEQILAVVRALWDGVMQVFDHFKEQAQRVFELFALAFEGDWYGFGEKLREIWDEAWKFIVETISKAWEFFRKALEILITKIINLIKTTDWKQVGINIIMGIGNGMISMSRWLVNTIRKVIAAALAAAKGILGIQSPSTVFAQIGEHMMTGMAQGINQKAMLPEGATKGVASLLTGSKMGEYFFGQRGGITNISLTYAPAFSLGNREELETRLAPLIQGMMRR